MDESTWAALRRRLLRGGVAPRFVARAVEELRAHQSDLARAAEVSGIGAEPARTRAQADLGGIDTIAERYLSQPALKSFGARWPWAVFTLGPSLLLFASLLILLLTADWLFDSLGAAIVDPLRWLALYGLPVGAVGVFAAYAARRRLHSAWLFAGGLLVIAVAAAANVDVVLAGTGHTGQVTAGVGAATRWDWALGFTGKLLAMSVVAWAWYRWQCRRAEADDAISAA